MYTILSLRRYTEEAQESKVILSDIVSIQVKKAGTLDNTLSLNRRKKKRRKEGTLWEKK